MIDASAGNRTTIEPMTATDAGVPRPVIRMMTGAMATSGTERSSSASGITPISTERDSENARARTMATEEAGKVDGCATFWKDDR